VDEFNKGSVMLTIDVLDFLSDWLQHHILGEDMEYSDFFVENGLS
jgi:hemerythrin